MSGKRIHPVTRTKVESSNIKSVGHCASCDGVYIQFANDALYHYPKAGKALFDEMMASESKGQFFHTKMKKLPAKRLKDWDE